MATDQTKVVSARSAKMDSGIMAVPECHIPLGYGTGTTAGREARRWFATWQQRGDEARRSHRQKIQAGPRLTSPFQAAVLG